MAHENTNIKCPNCGHVINVNEILYHQLEDEIRKDFESRSAEKDKEIRKEREKLKAELNEIEKRREDLDRQVAENVKKKLSSEMEKFRKDYKAKSEEESREAMDSLRKELEEKSQKVKELAKVRIEMEQLRREKEELGENIKLKLEKEFTDKLAGEKEKITKRAEEGIELKLKDREKVIEDLKEQLNEARRRAEQGSMQRQGEVQELAIEEWLKKEFPLDTIGEIKKGARGGDCIQTVNTRTRHNCGIIYYESKRTKDFQPSWIEKFKEDMRTKGAEFGVLVTEVMPKEMDRFGLKDGIWICTYEEFKGLCHVIREAVILLSDARESQENKGDKVNLLYDYLTGKEFRQQIEAIVEGFVQMESDLNKEKRAMEGLWKKRETQLRKVLLNTNNMYHSIKGIAGNAIGTIKVLELPEHDDEDEV